MKMTPPAAEFQSERTCTECKRTKSIFDFTLDRKTKAYREVCKSCMAAHGRTGKPPGNAGGGFGRGSSRSQKRGPS
jgi:hypothetical protein